MKPYTAGGKSREEYDSDLARRVAELQPDLIVLAGWMHILSPAFLGRFEPDPAAGAPARKRIPIINLHPALPGQFNGANAIERAFEAYKAGTLPLGDRTGIMVHGVTAVVDVGHVYATREVPVLPADSLHDLEQRIHAAEHRLLVDVVRGLCPAAWPLAGGGKTDERGGE